MTKKYEKDKSISITRSAFLDKYLNIKSNDNTKGFCIDINGDNTWLNEHEYFRYIGPRYILVLDIETTGFNHTTDCILELGMVELDTYTGAIVEKFHSTFKEDHLRRFHTNAWIFQNSSLTVNEIRDSRPLEDYREEIQTLLDAYTVTAWNSSFDLDFLTSRNFDVGARLMDPMKTSTNYFKLPFKNAKPQNIRGMQYKYPSAQEAYDILFPKEKIIEAHRGLDDAIFEAKIIYTLILLDVYSLKII